MSEPVRATWSLYNATDFQCHDFFFRSLAYIVTDLSNCPHVLLCHPKTACIVYFVCTIFMDDVTLYYVCDNSWLVFAYIYACVVVLLHRSMM